MAPTLLQAFAGRRPAEPELLRILAGLLDALQRLHAQGTVHGGLAPASVRLDPAGGILLEAPSAPAASAPGEILRLQVAPGYTPLEGYTPGATLSPATDLYGFGSVAFWLMTGEHPADAPARALEDRLPVLIGRKDLVAYCRELREAVDTCLWLQPGERPQRTEDVAAVLAPLLARLEAAAAEPGAFHPDPAHLAELRELLSASLLPQVAAALVERARSRATSWRELCDEVAQHVDEPDLRERIQARFAGLRAPAAAPAAVPEAAARFEPALLAALEGELKQILGAVARHVIARAAGRAQDRHELFRAISAEIDSPSLARQFLAWAETTLG